MPRQHYIWHNGDWVEYDRYAPRPKRLIVIGDSMPDTWNPATNRKYDSKSAYRRDTRAAGCEIVGNDNAHRTVPKAKVREPVETTIERLNQQKGWGL